MPKKNIRLNKEIAIKERRYVPNGLNELISNVKENDESLVRMNFEVSENIRNAFKSKVASQGKKVKDILATFMEEYIKSN